jgi:uncharacterized protein
MASRAQFLIILRPGRAGFPGDATEEEKAKVGEHFGYLKAATEAGDVILVGRTQDEDPIGLAVFEADDEAAARTFMENDPGVKAGVFKAELRPYMVALMREPVKS